MGDAWAARDEQGFAAFVTARRPELVAAAVVACGDAQEAEDLVQEALIKVAMRWHRLHDELPASYARRIIFRSAWRGWSRRGKRVHLMHSAEGQIEAAPGPDHTDAHAQRAELLDQLGELSPRQRAVLYLRYFEDLTERATADTLGISTGSVKRHAHLGLARLRALYEQTHLREAHSGTPDA
ncbi:SigE family RNA polymerase sigma factor [Ornithinimicrobium murale]|uniref:SigE family RNA polymerase sigma factor n=1 Tax=Ornithinimicrobium murale TaxID=1050153 RepID=UPI0013B40074|nr:SigE family RNA polymerase sigma factor [Ornithinimicrobium murale]